MHPIVIVGSGLAGYTLLKEIRKRDTATPVTLVTADDGAFYSKPSLSNAFATAGRQRRLQAPARRRWRPNRTRRCWRTPV